jgi:hypothetical protein
VENEHFSSGLRKRNSDLQEKLEEPKDWAIITDVIDLIICW